MAPTALHWIPDLGRISKEHGAGFTVRAFTVERQAVLSNAFLVSVMAAVEFDRSISLAS